MAAFNPTPGHPAVGFLVKLHAELGGRIRQNKLEGEKLQQDVNNVEAVIQLFDAAYNVDTIIPRRPNKPNTFFKRGTIFRQAVDVMRAKGEPMLVADITDAVFAAANIADPPQKERINLRTSIRSSLEHNAGKTVERVGEGVPMLWRIK